MKRSARVTIAEDETACPADAVDEHEMAAVALRWYKRAANRWLAVFPSLSCVASDRPSRNCDARVCLRPDLRPLITHTMNHATPDKSLMTSILKTAWDDWEAAFPTKDL